MSQTWWIAKRKLKDFYTDVITPSDIIEEAKWVAVVESDPELFWHEDTPHGKESVPFLLKNGHDFHFKHSAHFQINKKWGHGGLQIIRVNEGHIYTTSTKTTLKRILKLKEIADKLDCKLFRNRTEMTGEKYQKILEKY